jgi:hypothetical protein
MLLALWDVYVELCDHFDQTYVVESRPVVAERSTVVSLAPSQTSRWPRYCTGTSGHSKGDQKGVCAAHSLPVQQKLHYTYRFIYAKVGIIGNRIYLCGITEEIT